MSDIEKLGPWAALIASGQLLKDIYTDLAGPTIKLFGTTLKELVEFGTDRIVYPVRLIGEKQKLRFALNMKKYEEELNQLNIDQHIPVPPEIGHPILNYFAHGSDDEIAKAFRKLLINASIESRVHLVHPSFIKIVESLSTDQARIIEQLSKRKPGEKCILDTSFHTWHENDNSSASLWNIDSNKYFISREFTNLIFPEKTHLYIEHLIHLGVLQFVKIDDEYDSQLKAMMEKYKQDHEPYVWSEFIGRYNELHERQVFTTGLLIFTNLGSHLVNACIDR